ncbi:cytochrome P450 [Astrocystis sublimbata]|nr:cytochrome P450 [Astrocystis sublimbata]
MATALLLGYVLVCHLANRKRAAALAKAYKCEPIVQWPLKDKFFGLDYWWAIKKAADRHQLLDWLREQYDKYGMTYFTRIHITDIISTCDPENLKYMHTTGFANFAIDRRRQLAFLPLFGRHSVLLANGHEWEQKRSMLRPSFSREQYENTPLYETHVGRLIGRIKQSDCKVNLAPLFLCLTVDITSEVMFGKTIGLLEKDDANLLQNMTNSAEGGHASWLLAWLTKFVAQPLYFDSVKKVRDFMKQTILQEAILHRGALNKSLAENVPRDASATSSASSRAIYLETVAKATDDKEVMLDDLTTILFAGRDTTSALLTNLFFLFSRNPDTWQKLHCEVIEVLRPSHTPTHRQLKAMTYLQSCLKEALRLHPVIPINTRMAVKDTSLPRGGGADGKSPVFVAAGTHVTFHVTALHRRKDLWGDDADTFKPERWSDVHSTWKYQPFGMGPRNCPGQHLSLAEAAYVTARICQEFPEIRALEDKPWKELLAVTCVSASGAQVELVSRL